MKIKGIHHVAVICSDYEKSKRFYSEILGFPIINEHFRAERQSYKLDLQIGKNEQLELFSFPTPPLRPTRPEAAGLRHLAFEVEDIEVAIAALNSHDVNTEPIRTDEITGKRFTFFFDPDNLPLELYEL